MAKTILKKRVKLSGWSIFMTIVTMCFLVGICLWQFSKTENEFFCWLLLAIVTIWCFCTLFYSPIYIVLTEDSINVETLMRVRRFLLDQIVGVKICEPTMSEKRILGSGGYFVYFGFFR